MRVVCDTNVLVSSLLLPGSVTNKAVSIIFKKHTILLSLALISELDGVLSRKKFDNYISLPDRKMFLYNLSKIGEYVKITKKVRKCRDTKDNMILELALNGKADIVITGDRDLLDINSFKDIPIKPQDCFLLFRRC